MPAVARGNGTDGIKTFHGCTTYTTCSSCSINVRANGIGVHRENDSNTSHTIKVGDSCPSHSTTVIVGSPNVKVNGRGVARVGDRYNNCGQIVGGSPNVFANGG